MKSLKLNLSLIIILLFQVAVRGQQSSVTSIEDKKVLSKAETMPEYIGGEQKLFEFISKNLKYPETAKSAGISGKVYVNFVVDSKGKVSDAKILRGIGGGCDEEVLRIMSIMPDWIPGKNGGKAVSVYYNLPVNFALNEPEIKKEK